MYSIHPSLLQLAMNNSPETLHLRHGSSECVICPEIGGTIVAWAVDGQNMLRRTDSHALQSRDPLRFSSFPLVPFSNRIGFGLFHWLGEEIGIDPNFSPEPHAIHGIGWKSVWDAERISEAEIVMRYHHKRDSRWPWSFSATQHVRLDGESLYLKLEAFNLSEECAPLAFGHHPYFDQHGAFLQFDAKHVLMNDHLGLPTHMLSPEGSYDFRDGESVTGKNIDHCYADWGGVAKILWNDRPLGLHIESNMPAAVLYIPQYGESFCFEPVPHINNSLNRPADEPAMPTVPSGGSYRSHITLSAVPAHSL